MMNNNTTDSAGKVQQVATVGGADVAAKNDAAGGFETGHRSVAEGQFDTIRGPPGEEKVMAKMGPTYSPGGAVGDIDGILYRDTLLTTRTISNADGLFGNLFPSSFDPFHDWISDGLVASVLAPYALMRADIIVTARFTVPGSSYGLYCLQALAEGGRNTAAGVIPLDLDYPGMDNPFSSTQDVHGMMNAEEGNAVVLELPFFHHEDYVPTVGAISPYPRMWRLLLWPFMSLSSTINTTCTGQVKIYVRAKPGSVVLINPLQQGKRVDRVTYPVGKGKIGEGLRKASAVTEVLGKVPFLSAFAAPVSAGLAVATSIADILGFTREADPQPPTPVVPRFFSNLATTDSLDTSEVVGLFGGNKVAMGPALTGGPSEDPESLGSLFERWTYVGSFAYGTASDGDLASVPVTPFLFGTHAGSGGSVFTTAGYVGLPFGLWRGGMEFLVIVPSSPNLQGSLQVMWHPDGATSPSSSDKTNRLTNVVMDCHGSAMEHIVIGYSQAAPAQRAVPYAFSAAGSAGMNGRLYFRALTPLIGPKTGTYSTQVIVLARASDDMCFGSPAYLMRKSLPAPGGPMYVRDIQLQGNDVVEVDQTVLVPSKEYPTDQLLFGEIFASVRPLMQKFSNVAAFNYDAESGLDGVAGVLPHFVPAPSYVSSAQWNTIPNQPYGGTRVPFTWVGFYSSMFVGCRGSVRYKAVGAGTGGAPTVNFFGSTGNYSSGVLSVTTQLYNTIDGDDGASFVLPHVERQPVLAQGGAELTFPYYGAKKFYFPTILYNFGETGGPDVVDDLPIIVMGIEGKFDAVQVQLYVAAGSDYSLNRFRRVPVLNPEGFQGGD